MRSMPRSLTSASYSGFRWLPPPNGRSVRKDRSRSESFPLAPQLTLTGQRPACVEEPTFQRQVMRPPVFGPSPRAWSPSCHRSR